MRAYETMVDELMEAEVIPRRIFRRNQRRFAVGEFMHCTNGVIHIHYFTEGGDLLQKKKYTKKEIREMYKNL